MRNPLLGTLVACGAFFVALAAPALADSVCPYLGGNSAISARLNPGLPQFLCDATGNVDSNVKSISLPFNMAAGQTVTTFSAVGQALWNGTTADAWRDGPAGTAIANGTAGVAYTQGIGANGATPIVGTGTAGSPASQVVTIQGVSGGTAIPVSGTVTGNGTFNYQQVGASTGAGTSVSVTSTSTAVLASNANRLGAMFYNSGSVTVYLSLGFTPTTTSYTVPIAAGSLFELPIDFRGAINAITSSATDTLLVTELT